MHACETPVSATFFILTLLDIRAHVSVRFFCSRFCCLVIFPNRVLWVLDFCRVHARETTISATFYLHACSHSCPRFCEKRLGPFSFSFCRSRVLWVLDFCRVHAPETAVWHQLLPNLISLRVPRAYAHERIHAQTILTFVFQEHTLTRESMPKLYFRSCSKSIR